MLDSSKQFTSSGPIPPRSGIGLRAEHYDAVFAESPRVGFLEVHSENYFSAGGRARQVLDAAAAQYPLSFHGVGLSLGSVDALSVTHLRQLKALNDRYAPLFVSEHLSWTSFNGRHLHSLLPLPYTEEALQHVCTRIAQTQDFLGRRILIENPSSYLQFEHSTIAEWDFLAAVAKSSDCDILLDVNNVFVSAHNLGFDPLRYLSALPIHRVAELHLAGHTEKHTSAGTILIDTHNRPVSAAVWRLYQIAAARFSAAPTLIEWDSELPTLEVLIDEAHRANNIREDNNALAA